MSRYNEYREKSDFSVFCLIIIEDGFVVAVGCNGLLVYIHSHGLLLFLNCANFLEERDFSVSERLHVVG